MKSINQKFLFLIMCINIKTEKDMDNRIKALIGTLNILSDLNFK